MNEPTYQQNRQNRNQYLREEVEQQRISTVPLSRETEAITREYTQLKSKVQDRIKQLQSRSQSRQGREGSQTHISMNQNSQNNAQPPIPHPVYNKYDQPNQNIAYPNAGMGNEQHSFGINLAASEHEPPCRYCMMDQEYMRLTGNPSPRGHICHRNLHSQSISSAHSRFRIPSNVCPQVQSMYNINSSVPEMSNPNVYVHQQNYGKMEGFNVRTSPHGNGMNNLSNNQPSSNPHNSLPISSNHNMSNPSNIGSGNLSINEALIQNLKAQKQMNTNLRALSQKLSDLSVKRSDSSAFLDQHHQKERERADDRDRLQRYYRYNRYPDRYPDHPSNDKYEDRYYLYGDKPMHGYYAKIKDRCMECQYARARSGHKYPDSYRCDGRSSQDQSCHRRHDTQTFNHQPNFNINHQKYHDIERYSTHSHSHSHSHRFAEDPTNKRPKTKLNGNQTDKQSQRNSHKHRNSQVHPIYPNFHRNQSSKNSSKHLGRAKSVSVQSSSLKNSKHKKSVLMRGVKDLGDSKKERSNCSKSNRNFDSQYFVSQREDLHCHHHKHPHNSNHRQKREKNGKNHNHHDSSKRKQRKQCRRHDHRDRVQNVDYCPLHTTNQVLALYEAKARNKKDEIYKDSQYRNRKHERQHLMKAFQQQEKSRRQLLAKISKNFFSSYGVK